MSSTTNPSPSTRNPNSGRRWHVLAAAATAWVALASVLFVWSGRFSLSAVERACGAPAPDVRTAPSAVEVRAFLEACGADGLAAYRDLQLIDLLYPAVNAALLVVVLGLLMSRSRSSLRWMLVLPVLAAVGDYTENVAAWTMLGQPGQETWADALFPVGSAVKVAATSSAWLAVMALLGWLAIRWVGARASRRDDGDAQLKGGAATAPIAATPRSAQRSDRRPTPVPARR